MSPLRRIVAFIGFVMLLISFMFLFESLWPAQRTVEVQPLTPGDLSLPAPQSAVPGALLTMLLVPPRRRARLALALLIVIALAVACAGAPPPQSAEPTFEAVEATSAPGAPSEPEPTQPPAVTATAISPSSTLAPAVMPQPPESRAVEIDYPLTLRVGDSEVIRLALVIADDGTYLTPTAESGGRVARGAPAEIPNLYNTHTITATARLDSVGLTIDRPGDWEQPLLPGDNVVWRWTIAADEAGRQKANVIIRLRFIPKEGGDIRERELWARTLTIESTTVFGLPGPLATAFGAVGSVLGTVLGFPFADKLYAWLWSKIKRMLVGGKTSE